MKLMEGFDSNYRYILVAARRARQIQGGARPMVETVARKPCKIAQQEIEAGKVKFVVGEEEKSKAAKVSELLDQAMGAPR